MDTKILMGVIMALLISVLPVAQAQELTADIKTDIKSDVVGAEGKAKVEVKTTGGGETEIKTETKLSSEIKIELDKIRSQKSATIKEAIEKRRALFEGLKQRLLNATPQERSEITKEINKARLEGLREIKALIKNAADLKVFEKEKLEIAVEKCKELNEGDECEKEIKEIQKKVDSLTDQQLEKLKKLKQKTDSARKKAEDIGRSEEFKKFKIRSRTDVGAREVAEDKLKTIKEKTEKLQTEALKTKMQASKESFGKTKVKSEGCKEESQECKKIKTEIKMSAKAFLMDSLGFLEARLEKSKLAIEAEASITETESATEIQKIDAHIEQIRQLKQKAGEITEETDKAVIQDLAKQTAKELAGLKTDLEHSAGFVSASKIGGIVVKAAKLSEKLNRALEKMSLEKRDTAETEAFVDSFNKQIDEVKNGVEVVQQKFKQAALKTGEERNQLVKDAHKSLKELKDKLNELQKQLKEVVRSLKNRGSEKALEETKADPVLETEEKVLAEATAEAAVQTSGG